MRRACAVLLSLSLNVPTLFAYDDYSDSDWNSSRGSSVQQFQNDWLTRQSWIQSFNQSPYSPPLLQFPKYDFDLDFYHSFSNFNANNVTPSQNFDFNRFSPLDLDFNSLTTPVYKPQPVVENFQFQTDTVLASLPSTTNTQQDTGRLAALSQSFRQDNLPDLRSQDMRLPDDFSRLTENDPTKSFSPAPSQNLTLAPQIESAKTLEEVVQTQPNPAIPPSLTFETSHPIEALHPPTNLFDTVARAIKVLPSLFASLGSKIQKLFTQVWNHVVLGHRTKTNLTLPDGTRLTGHITVNRKGEILKVSPGTLRSVGKWETNDKGQTSLHPADYAVTLNGEKYLQGTFTYDGENYHLQGPGIKLTTQVGPTLEGTEQVKLYVQGDGLGGEAPLGYGATHEVGVFRETTTNLSFHGSNSYWKLDPQQSGTLTLDGQRFPITIDDKGRLSSPISAPLTQNPSSKMFITALIPNPETSGFQVLAVAQLKDKDTLKTRIPGSTPSPLTTTQANNWRQDASVPLITDKLTLSLKTQSKIHQEGDHYVFTGGHVSFATLTEPNMSGGKSTPKGQKSLYSEAVFSNGSHLTVTGPTMFPNYRTTTVFVGNVSFHEKEMSIERGSIYANEREGLRLSIAFGPNTVAIPVKSVDLKNGTFIAVLPDLPRSVNRTIDTLGKEVKGKIDFETGQATLVPVSFKAPIIAPDKLLGVHVDDFVVATAWVTVGHNNDIKVQLDRSGLGLDDWKKLEPPPTFNTPIHDSFRTLTFIVQDKDNPLWSRAAALTLSSLMGPALFGEGVVDYLKGLPAAARETTHFAALTTVSLENKDYPEATLNALQTIASGSDATLRVLALLDFAGQTTRALGAELKPLAQSARQWLNKLPTVTEDFFQPVMNERGNLLVKNPQTPARPRVFTEKSASPQLPERPSPHKTKDLVPYWPKNRGFLEPPTKKILEVGELIDRYGNEKGRFVSPTGTPFEMRSLPPTHKATEPYSVYEVKKPFEVEAGKAMPAFGQLGQGTQYRLPKTVEGLIREGYIRRIRGNE